MWLLVSFLPADYSVDDKQKVDIGGAASRGPTSREYWRCSGSWAKHLEHFADLRIVGAIARAHDRLRGVRVE